MFIVAPQILAILATCVSWVWWVTFLLSFMVMILFQVFWCCRHSKNFVSACVVLAGVCSLVSFGVGVYVSVTWTPWNFCEPWFLDNDDGYVTDDEYPGGYDECAKWVWATIAYLCAALWAGAGVITYRFVRTGRHTMWEEEYNGNFIEPLLGEEPVVGESNRLVNEDTANVGDDYTTSIDDGEVV